MASITVGWNPPLTGPAPAGYKLYYGTAPGVYGPMINVGNPTGREATIDSLTYDTMYYIAMTAFAANGSESGFSAEISASVPDPTPNPPVGLVVTGMS